MPYVFDRIDPSRTAMIVVDMQNDFVADGALLQSKQALALADELAETRAKLTELEADVEPADATSGPSRTLIEGRAEEAAA